MKGLGFAAVGLTAVSFVLWLVSWLYWTFQQFGLYDPANYDSQKTLRYVFQGVSVAASLTEYMAILLIAVAIIMAAKRLPQI